MRLAARMGERNPARGGAGGREIDALRATVAPDLFAGFDPKTFPRTSIPAFGLAAAAYRVDDATGEAVSFALRNARSSSTARTSPTPRC